MQEKIVFNLKENLTEKFVAFIDVMGFKNLVNNNNVQNLEEYFVRISEVLDEMKIKKEKIESFLISDSIILIAPQGLESFRQLLIAIRRIQSALLWKKILLRGSISYGKIYYNGDRNVVVGKGFINAYLLEQEAIYPRIIIDPAIIKLMDQDKAGFLKQVNKSIEYRNRLIYVKSDFSLLSEDCIFVDYANKALLKDKVSGNLSNVYQLIKENIYSQQKLFSKYIWLRDYFIESLKLTKEAIELESTPTKKAQIKIIDKLIGNFERL